MDDFGSSRTIHAVRNLKIDCMLEKIKINNYYMGLSDRLHVKNCVDNVAGKLRKWLLPIIDLSLLPYSYHTNGTHNGIEQWLVTENRPIYCFRGEYPYLMQFNRRINIVDHTSEIPANGVVYMSNPFSSTGNYDNRYYSIPCPVILDIAYVGTTSQKTLQLSKSTEQVFWSASKAFGVGNFRTGFKFTKFADKLQDQIKDVGYCNLLSNSILEQAISLFGVCELNDLYSKLYKDICNNNNLIPSDSFLIALSNDDKYKHLEREDGNIRIPVGRILDQIIYKV